VARIVIHHMAAHRESDQAAYRFVRSVLHEIRFQARLTLFHGPYTTGRLAQSIEIKGPYIEPGRRVHGSVGSDLSYAAVVEKGARPHLIFPIPPRKYMKFYWRRVGRVVYPDKVRHPGMRGKGYLRNAAQVAARRHRMLLIIYDV
jgi:hypothetical protein